MLGFAKLSYFYGILNDETGELVDENNESLGVYSYRATELPLSDNSYKECLIVDSLDTCTSNLYFDIETARKICSALTNANDTYTIVRFTKTIYEFLDFDTMD